MAYTVTNCLAVIKEIFFPTQPKYKELTFTQEAYAKLMCYINLIGDYEITGFGRVVDNKIVDIAILKQTVKSATVDCDVDAMQEFLMSIPKDQMGQWVLDWHSHVNMGVFASGTDTTNYEEQWKARLNNQYPLIIVNKKQEIFARCYISPAKWSEITIKKEQGGLTQDRLIEIYNECVQEVEQKCKKDEPKYTYTHTGNNYFGRYYNTDYDNDYDAWDNNKQTTLDLRNFKKKGLAEVKKEEKSASDNYCWSCGEYLMSPEEYDRGICDDCWEQIPDEDKVAWIQAIKENYRG